MKTALIRRHATPFLNVFFMQACMENRYICTFIVLVFIRGYSRSVIIVAKVCVCVPVCVHACMHMCLDTVFICLYSWEILFSNKYLWKSFANSKM